MRDNKCSVRYLGYRTLTDGGRGFDFSFASTGAAISLVTVEAAAELFTGPNQIAIQEGAGICYETVKDLVESEAAAVPNRLLLTAADVAQHRKILKPHGRRH